nr:phosphosulfolactate synthase [Arthrobacter castelli]
MAPSHCCPANRSAPSATSPTSTNQAGPRAKPELGGQFSSDGDSTESELAAEGKKDVGEWNTAAAASIIKNVGLENVMFEAAEPLVFEWYVKNYGNEVNLFVDHSQILQVEGLRQNIRGNKSTWGRIVYPAPAEG